MKNSSTAKTDNYNYKMLHIYILYYIIESYYHVHTVEYYQYCVANFSDQFCFAPCDTPARPVAYLDGPSPRVQESPVPWTRQPKSSRSLNESLRLFSFCAIVARLLRENLRTQFAQLLDGAFFLPGYRQVFWQFQFRFRFHMVSRNYS